MTAIAFAAAPTETDPRWRAVLARDAAADDSFVYAVRTTGVYCRPSCPSRRARPEHVGFFADGKAAAAAGFRPCRRCRPDLPPLAARQAETIATACRLLETAEELPTLQRLAAAVGMSAFHFHRRRTAELGVSPRASGAARRDLRHVAAQGQAVATHRLARVRPDPADRSTRRRYRRHRLPRRQRRPGPERDVLLDQRTGTSR